MILLGVVMLSLGLELFLTPHKITPGGIKGIAILLSHITEMKMGLLLLFINLPFVIFKRVNLTQTLSALLIFLIIAILVIYMHPFPALIQDPLLAAICGGITFGIGVGLVVRYGWYADGVNDVASYLKKRTKLSISELLMIINICVLSCGGFMFGWDQAIHSIIAYFLAYKTIQLTLDYNRNKLISVRSEYNEELRHMLLDEFQSDIQFLTTDSQLPVTKDHHLFIILPKKNVKNFLSILTVLDPSAKIEISLANVSQSEPYYRI